MDVPITQSSLSRVIDLTRYESFLQESPDPRSKTVALSSSIPHAGDWLNTVPCPALGLHLSDLEFRLCLRYWLGLPMSSEDDAQCPVCEVNVDVMGDHLVTCRGNGDLIHRHDSLWNVIHSAAQSAALAPRMECPSLIPNSSSRPADILLPCWKLARPAALDVTVILPVQQLTIVQASVNQGYAFSVAEDRKYRSHYNDCSQAGVLFIPLAMETFGGWSSVAASTIREIGKLQAYRLGLSSSNTISHLFQRLSITLWRGNAAMWAARSPILSPIDDGVV